MTLSRRAARTADAVDATGSWVLLATLGALALLAAFGLGADAWAFEPSRVEPRGLLGPLVRAADEEWNTGLIRSSALVAALLVAAAAALFAGGRVWRARSLAALTAVVVALIAIPPVLLQLGLRDASEPWFFTNDSTYQIELAGDLVLDGDNPYGHDYRFSGLERFYSLNGSVGAQTRDEQVALRHFAYFPGTALSAAAWRLLPAPLDDYRLLVLLSTLALLAAIWLVPAPTAWRLALGAVAVANPLAVHAAWFGNADAPSLLCVVLAFALPARRRELAGAAVLAIAVLLKQFALVALPFYAAALVARRVPRRALIRAGTAFAAIVLAGVLPFVIADPSAFWNDTIEYGSGTYRIVGYGLSNLLLQAGVLDDRNGAYPFTLLALLVWLPITAWLVRAQLRSRELWTGALGFAISTLVLVFLARAFHKSYLVWPFVGIVLAAALAAAERLSERARSPAR